MGAWTSELTVHLSVMTLFDYHVRQPSRFPSSYSHHTNNVLIHSCLYPSRHCFWGLIRFSVQPNTWIVDRGKTTNQSELVSNTTARWGIFREGGIMCHTCLSFAKKLKWSSHSSCDPNARQLTKDNTSEWIMGPLFKATDPAYSTIRNEWTRCWLIIATWFTWRKSHTNR